MVPALLFAGSEAGFIIPGCRSRVKVKQCFTHAKQVPLVAGRNSSRSNVAASSPTSKLTLKYSLLDTCKQDEHPINLLIALDDTLIKNRSPSIADSTCEIHHEIANSGYPTDDDIKIPACCCGI